jgi:hypothetical protein
MKLPDACADIIKSLSSFSKENQESIVSWAEEMQVGSLILHRHYYCCMR